MNERDELFPGWGLPVLDDKRWYSTEKHCYRDPNHWLGSQVCTREISMVILMNELMEKPGWDSKVYDETIGAKWKAEALGKSGFTEKEWAYCLAELRDKAKVFRETGIVHALDYDCEVVYCDGALPPTFAEELCQAVSSLENIPEREKDWHPGSDGQVLDLVHPSLYPLVFGRSRALMKGKVDLLTSPSYTGQGEVVPVPPHENGDEEHLQGFYGESSHSRRFQWLPCDVQFCNGDTVRINSYINNLHPAHHKPLYALIERAIAASIPLWDVVLQSLANGSKPRLPVPTDHEEIYTVPDGGNFIPDASRGDAVEHENGDGNLGNGETGQIDDYDDDEDEDDWKRTNRILRWPEPEPYQPGCRGCVTEPMDLRKKFKDTGLQIIVKLASIYLTPEKPRYPGGSWHVEGMRNERIVASSLYYYSTDNISRSSLRFRQYMNTDTLDWKYEQGDYDGWFELLGLDEGDAAISELGAVETKQGRLLAFPNVLQHQVPAFELDDKTKPGHRKILALFLVDPVQRILSTGKVPPQQKKWWEEHILADENVNRMSNMPAELKQLILERVDDFPISLDETKKVREELMEERSHAEAKDQEHNESNRGFSFCEH